MINQTKVLTLKCCESFSVSPPGGDFSDPVTSATLGIVQVCDGCVCVSVGVHAF